MELLFGLLLIDVAEKCLCKEDFTTSLHKYCEITGAEEINIVLRGATTKELTVMRIVLS
jgi:hypothetical protein